MNIKNIYDSWGSVLDISYQELLSLDTESFLKPLLYSRNLLFFRNISDIALTDDEFFDLGQKFGRVWKKEDYARPEVALGKDTTLRNPASDKPVSYLQSNNNSWKDRKMNYHADMPHIVEHNYPARILNMNRNTEDESGATTWLNL